MKLLLAHKREQAEVKLRNRLHWTDTHSLMFAQQWELQSSSKSMLGAPLTASRVDRQLKNLCEKSGVKRISMHGLRHTSATLALSAGVPSKVVQSRLGHKSINVTLDIYGHVLPSMQQDAASKIGKLIHG